MAGATARQGYWSEFKGTPPGAASHNGQPGVGGAVGNQQGQDQPDQARPASQRFVVRQNDLAAVTRPGAASYAAPMNGLMRQADATAAQ